jgi:hypothetical protein
MTNSAEEPTVLPEAHDADRFEQQLPVLPDEADEDAGTEPGPALAEGSEADRIEQATGIFGADDDDYPHGSAD